MDDHSAMAAIPAAFNPTSRLSYPEVLRYAASAVHKVDLLGPDGTEICTVLEIEALTMIAACSGLLPDPGQDPANAPNPVFKSRRTKNV